MPTHRKQFAVIGLGRFGSSVCRTLHDLGHEVMAIDRSDDLTRSAVAEEIASHVVQADATDSHSLDELNMHSFDAVVVAIGADLESSVLTVLNLLDVGVKQIVAKASHDKHGKVLERVGGGQVRVVYPESQMGERVAFSLGGMGIIESIEIDPDYSIIEIPAPAILHGKTLHEADLRARYGVSVIAIKTRDGVNIAPLSEDRIQAGDIIAVIGHNDRLRVLQQQNRR